MEAIDQAEGRSLGNLRVVQGACSLIAFSKILILGVNYAPEKVGIAIN